MTSRGRAGALPDEVLRIIFTTLFDIHSGDDIELDRWAIAKVCVHWRRTALGQSFLWRFIDILWPEARYQAWMERAGAQNLMIRLLLRTPGPWWLEDSRLPLRRCLETISERKTALARAASIHVVIPAEKSIPILPSDLLEIFECLFDLTSSIEDLIVGFRSPATPPRPLLPASLIPNSVRLLRVFGSPMSDLRFPDLTYLDLGHVNCAYEHWVSLFRSMRKLKLLRLRWVTSVGVGGNDLVPEGQLPVILSELKTMHFSDVDPVVEGILWDHCRITDLEFFEIIQKERRHILNPWYLDDRIPMIKTFSGEAPSPGIRNLLLYLATLPRLQHVKLNCPYPEIRDFLRDFIISRMTLHRNPVDGRKALRTLQLDNCPDEEAEWIREHVDKLFIFGDQEDD